MIEELKLIFWMFELLGFTIANILLISIYEDWRNIKNARHNDVSHKNLS